MENSDRWADYLKQTLYQYNSPLEFAVDHWDSTLSIYRRIKKIISPPASILEIGVGFGFSAIYLQSCGYHVVGLDNDTYALDMARQNATWLAPGLQVEYGEAANLQKYYGQFDLAFSAGVLEHFERAGTITLLSEQAKCARYVMTTIPTKNTKYAAEITDEHFYSARQFRVLFKEAGLVDVNSFGFGGTPSLIGRLARYCLPLIIYQFLLDHAGLGMGVGCIGRSLIFEKIAS